MAFNIAIDGPAGAGKSTIAKQIAKKLSFVYVDTGAMYRSIALYMIRNSIDIYNEEAVSNVCSDIHISIKYEREEQQVILNEENVTSFIRAEEVGVVASVVSAYPKVRETLLKLQQQLAASNDVIMDGRDIGTCVLPNADVKIYLTADARVRANRRYLELKKKGQECNIDEIEKDIVDRDYRDMTREISPLCQAEDAVVVNTSDMNIDEVIDAIIAIVNANKMSERKEV